MPLELEAVDIHGLLQNSLSMVKEKALTHRIQLDLNIQEGIGIVQVDARKSKQIIYNLLSNAVKFTPEGGRVSIRARKVRRNAFDKKRLQTRTAPAALDDFLELSITDTGIGISEEGMKRLFEPFVQLDSSLSRQYEGTGLGLAMVKRLTELHDGTVGVESEVGKGSSFTVWLPYRTEYEAVISVESGDKAIIQPMTGRGVPLALVVEDDEQAAKLIRLQLEGLGFQVIWAATAEIGLELAASHHPDLITLDIMLPSMDGWDFLGRIKADATLAAIPVVIISIIADTRKGFSLGAASVLQKPIHKEELEASLAALGMGADYRGQPITVLVADDDPRAIEIISRYLESEHYTVLCAYGGQEAIDTAQREILDLIVLDLMMPEVSGFEVVEALKTRPETAQIPILILTAKVITAEDRKILNGHILKIVEKAEFSGGRFTGEVRRAIRAKGLKEA
jgi:CheY-like chemotaxis protein